MSIAADRHQPRRAPPTAADKFSSRVPHLSLSIVLDHLALAHGPEGPPPYVQGHFALRTQALEPPPRVQAQGAKGQILVGDALAAADRRTARRAPSGGCGPGRLAPGDLRPGDHGGPHHAVPQEPGQAGLFDVHEIHSIQYTEGAKFVRVTGVDMAQEARRVYDPETGTVRVIEHVGTGSAKPNGNKQ